MSSRRGNQGYRAVSGARGWPWSAPGSRPAVSSRFTAPMPRPTPPAPRPPIRTALASVEVEEIDVPNGTPEARLAVEVRNNLIFGLTGGAGQLPPTHQLKINLERPAPERDRRHHHRASGHGNLRHRRDLQPDRNLRPRKMVLTGRAFARASYDIPGQEQRFARQRGAARRREPQPRPSSPNRSSRGSRRISSPAGERRSADLPG